MIALKTITALLGLAFSFFGYLIYFKKKYNLINGFEKDLRLCRKTETYAKNVGIIEFIIGVVFLLTFLLLIIFA